MNRTVKVGLLSTQFTINYGAVLQAFSLFNKLKKMPNTEVCAIDYAPKSARYGHFESYNFSSVKMAILSLLKMTNLKYRNARKEKIMRFEEFVTNEFTLTKNKFSTNAELKNKKFAFDLAVVGSDQVWNPKVINDSSFYFDFLTQTDTVLSSYAASLGGELTQEEMKQLIHHLKNFDHVSIREPIHVNEIESELEKSIEVLIDPVFLTSKKDWEEIATRAPTKNTKPYVLVYEVNSPPSFKKYVDMLKEFTEYEIIEISTRPFSKYSNVNTVSNAGPYDFLKLFSGAEFVLTSSFHGVAFSSILNKSFACVLNKERSTRQRHLLQHLCLSECELTHVNALKGSMTATHNWEQVNNKINDLATKSNDYLEKLLNYDA